MYDQCLRETETSTPVAPCTLYVKKKCTMFPVLFNASIEKEEKERKGGGAGGRRVKGSVILTTLADLSLHTP